MKLETVMISIETFFWDVRKNGPVGRLQSPEGCCRRAKPCDAAYFQKYEVEHEGFFRAAPMECASSSNAKYRR